ncbi:unnamed protein product [Parnassius apollo]|uniref:(apollo) hypothetical protein n=1 Tax=Parnassius apollo TaxID=110799 RepID=A0A8S3W6E3_PARAO|nr:unnamed protein product [Parnassius apollo]
MKVPLLLCAYSIIQYWDTSKCSKTVPISKSKVEFIPPRFSISLESRARLFSYAYALHAALGRHIVKNAEQTLNIEKSPDTIFISNNDEVGEIQQYVEENSWPLNEVHNRSVEQVINMESVQTIRFVASQHEPANEASNLRGGEDKENNIQNNREPSPSTPLSKNNASEEKKKLTRKRQRNPEAWKKNKNKCLKNSGMAYTTEKGKLVNAKQLKPGCGDKCRLKCTLKINEQQRLSNNK